MHVFNYRRHWGEIISGGIEVIKQFDFKRIYFDLVNDLFYRGGMLVNNIL